MILRLFVGYAAGSVIEVYKTARGTDKKIFSPSRDARTRGHPMKLNNGRFRTD